MITEERNIFDEFVRKNLIKPQPFRIFIKAAFHEKIDRIRRGEDNVLPAGKDEHKVYSEFEL